VLLRSSAFAMKVSEQNVNVSNRTCVARNDYKNKLGQDSDPLFENDWEVFVIKRDTERNAFEWFTLCCEKANLDTA